MAVATIRGLLVAETGDYFGLQWYCIIHVQLERAKTRYQTLFLGQRSMYQADHFAPDVE